MALSSMQMEKLNAVFCIMFTRMFSAASVAKMVCRFSSAMKEKSRGCMEIRICLFLKI